MNRLEGPERLARRFRRTWSFLANRRRLAIALVGLAALFASSVPYLLYSRSLTPFSSWSFFTAYDEFSYLLAADTYASGRLTNPTHEMWRHFATRSVIHEPTYQSVYPPGQGLFLAMGMLLTGHPIVGVWISVALACSATCYLLQAWFPPRWALFGGLIVALHARISLEWGGTYWGGAVAMLGGALTFGGLRHLLRRPGVLHALAFSVGLAVLANSRPFEGLVASLPALAVLAAWLVWERKHPPRVLVAKVLAPVLVVLSVTAAGMGYYNYRVTGRPWTLPYQLYLDQTGAAPTFIWQNVGSVPEVGALAVSASFDDEPSPPVPRRVDDEEQYGLGGGWWLARLYLNLLMHPEPVVAVIFKLAVLWAFYLGPILTVPLLALPWATKERWTWFAVSTTGLTLLAVLTTIGAYPHYLAPVTPLIVALVVLGTRRVHGWRRGGRRVGRRIVPAMALLWSFQLLLVVVLFPRLLDELRWGEARARLRAGLESAEGKHLVIVRYGARHAFYKEWVYNEADIDDAKVVWARELSTDANRRLLAYFRERRVWLVELDRGPPSLLTYPLGERSARGASRW